MKRARHARGIASSGARFITGMNCSQLRDLRRGAGGWGGEGEGGGCRFVFLVQVLFLTLRSELSVQPVKFLTQ